MDLNEKLPNTPGWLTNSTMLGTFNRWVVFFQKHLKPKHNAVNSHCVTSYPYICLQYLTKLNSTLLFGLVWRYLARGFIWHLSQSSIRPSIQFSLIVKSCSNPFLEPTSTKGIVSCSRKQRVPLIGLEPTTSTLRVRRATHCPTPPLYSIWFFCFYRQCK